MFLKAKYFTAGISLQASLIPKGSAALQGHTSLEQSCLWQEHPYHLTVNTFQHNQFHNRSRADVQPEQTSVTGIFHFTKNLLAIWSENCIAASVHEQWKSKGLLVIWMKQDKSQNPEI